MGSVGARHVSSSGQLRNRPRAMVRMEFRQRPTAPSSNDRPSPSSVAHLPVQGCHRLTMTSTYPGSVWRTRACLPVRWQAINVEPAKMSTLAIDKARVS